MIQSVKSFYKFYSLMIENGIAYYKRNEDGTKTQIVTRYDFIKTFNDAWVEQQLDFILNTYGHSAKVDSRTRSKNSSKLHEEELKETFASESVNEAEPIKEETSDPTGILEQAENETFSYGCGEYTSPSATFYIEEFLAFVSSRVEMISTSTITNDHCSFLPRIPCGSRTSITRVTTY